jgi:hypothetical protein
MICDSGQIFALRCFAVVLLLCACPQARSQSTKTNYPKMAQVDQYFMERNAEIALARSAAPSSISQDAGVLVLGQHGYESAVKSQNGFVCVVQRSWTAGADDPDFWNPKLRAPACFNPPAARSNLPIVLRKTELVLEGKSKEQMFDSLRAAFDKKELPLPEPNSMCYMMSSQAYLSDADGRWDARLPDSRRQRCGRPVDCVLHPGWQVVGWHSCSANARAANTGSEIELSLPCR